MMDSRFRGNDDAATVAVHSRISGSGGIHTGRAQNRHSRESGNPVRLSQPQEVNAVARGSNITFRKGANIDA